MDISNLYKYSSYQYMAWCLLLFATLLNFNLGLSLRSQSENFNVNNGLQTSGQRTTSVVPKPPKEVLPAYLPPTVPDTSLPPVANGLAPLVTNLVTKQPVVFLGIDDGLYKNTAEVRIMKEQRIKASLFLTYDAIKDNPNFFKGFENNGSLIEDHTVHHRLLSKLTYQQQKDEICGQADLQLQLYGRRPVLFRPPGGDYNTNTRRAAADCGMKAVVLWIAKSNGGSMQYQIGDRLRAGDIVLMHFRPEFKQDLSAFIKAQNAAGLHTELLEDWLPS